MSFLTEVVSFVTKTKSNWYRARTVSGLSAGLGFECPKCHLCFRHSASQEIFHCGALESAPRFLALLPEKTFGKKQNALPPNVIPVFGFDDENEKPNSCGSLYERN